MLAMQFVGLMLGATLAHAAQFMAPSAASAPSHEAFTALLRVKGKPLDPMVSSLAAMAESISKQEPSAREQSVNSIKTLLQGLLDSITSQHTIAQKSVTNQSTFDSCNAQKLTDLANAENVKIGVNWTDTTDAYNTCQAEFQAMNDTFTSCYQQDDPAGWISYAMKQEEMLRVAATARCEYFESVDRSSNFQSWFCHEDDFPASSSYEAYLQRNIEMLADFRNRRANCTNATAAQSSKMLECTGYQQQASAKEVMCAHLTPYANPADCSSYEAKKQACISYSHCRTQAQHESSSAAATADQLAESLKVQWEGLKRIECLLDVISKSGDAAAMQACVAAGHDTSALNIIVPAVPAAQPCDAGVAPAGCA